MTDTSTERPRIVSVETEALPDRANPQLLVRLTSDDGLVGVGETWWGTYQPDAMAGAPVAPIAAVIDHLLGPGAVGRDATDIDGLWHHLHRLSYQYGPGGIVSTGLAGIDLAMWDLAGRRHQCPVADLLGPRLHDEVPAYASLHWLGDADRAVADAGRAVHAGFRAVKLHESQPEIINAVRAAIGPGIVLMVDVSARLTEAQTIELARNCAPADLHWIEEPIFPQQDHETLARIRAAVSIPIAAGENEFGAEGFRRLLKAEAVDVVQPDLAKCGGLTPTPAIVDAATAAGVTVCPHNFSLGPSLGANIHWAMTVPGIGWIEVPFLPEGQDFPGPWHLPTLTAQGTIPYPTGVGLDWD